MVQAATSRLLPGYKHILFSLMHLPRLFSIVAVTLCALLLGACSSTKINYDMHAAIVGTWKGDQSGALLTIFGDGRFILEHAVNSPQDAVIKGTLQRGKDQILFKYTMPAVVCGNSTGVYRFSRMGDTLNFEPVREDCPARAAQIDSTWTIQSRTPTPTSN